MNASNECLRPDRRTAHNLIPKYVERSEAGSEVSRKSKDQGTCNDCLTQAHVQIIIGTPMGAKANHLKPYPESGGSGHRVPHIASYIPYSHLAVPCSVS